MLRLAISLALVAMPAFAQDPTLRYATFPDCATAQQVSASAWNAVKCTTPGCDKAAVTTSWYQVVGLTDLTKCAVVIHLGDVYQGENITINGRTFALTAGQIASLATRQGMGTQLGDILPVALVGTRLGATGKTAAVNTAVNGDPALKTDYQTLTSKAIDLQDPLLGSVMSRLVAKGALTDADVAAITAAQAVTVVPN